MYKRTKYAIEANPPDVCMDVCMFNAQYNKAKYQEEISFTITTKTDSSGTQVILEKMKQLDKVVLGWTRDAKGNIINRHPVEVANCVTSAKRDNTQNYVVVHANTKTGEQLCEVGGVIDISYPSSSSSRRGRVQENGTIAPTLTCGCENTHARIEPNNTDIDGNARTICAGYYKYGFETLHDNTFGTSGTSVKQYLQDYYRIRKLTEREVFRLMGVHDEDSDKIRSVVSKSQCYKLAGNSIVVDVLVAIFRELLTKHEIPKFKQLKLF